MATAASAAAMVMIKMEKNTPSNLSGYKYLLKATKLILTLFSISSTDINMVIIFLRVNKPYIPIKKRAVLTKRIWLRWHLHSFVLRFYFHGNDNTTDHCSKQQHTYHFKWYNITMFGSAQHLITDVSDTHVYRCNG